MRWSDATASPSDRRLREFAGVALAALVLLALWRLLTAGFTPWVIGFVAAALVVGLGLIRPRWLAPLFTLWMIAVFPIAWLVSHVLLAIIYYGLITPLGLLFRLLGRDVLDRRWPASQDNSSEDSYWRDKPSAGNSTHYLRQF